MLARLAALALLGVVAACGGDSDTTTGARIAAIRVVPGNPPRFALVTMRDDGANVRAHVRAPAGGVERLEAPAWSPDGTRLYFVGVLAEREGDRFIYYEADVFVVDAGGGEPRRVTRSRDVRAVVPSPDGETLLVGRDDNPGRRPFSEGLWLVDADGGNARRLLPAQPGRFDLAGSWSPDSRTIAFTRCTFSAPGRQGLVRNTCSVLAASRDGSRVRTLAERSKQPSFSPDGRAIAFVSDRDENGMRTAGSDEVAFANELYVMAANGDAKVRLTETESLDEGRPAWSADGTRIAYEREGPARFKRQLMVAKADGDSASRLIGDGADMRISQPSFLSPAWHP